MFCTGYNDEGTDISGLAYHRTDDAHNPIESDGNTVTGSPVT